MELALWRTSLGDAVQAPHPLPPGDWGLELWRGRHFATLPLSSVCRSMAEDGLPYTMGSRRHPAGLAVARAGSMVDPGISRPHWSGLGEWLHSWSLFRHSRERSCPMKRFVLFVAALVIAISSQGCCSFDCCSPCGGGGCSPCGGSPCGNSCGPGYGANYAPPPSTVTPPAGAYQSPYQGPMIGSSRPVSYSSYYGAQPSLAALPPGPLSTF